MKKTALILILALAAPGLAAAARPQTVQDTRKVFNSYRAMVLEGSPYKRVLEAFGKDRSCDVVALGKGKRLTCVASDNDFEFHFDGSDKLYWWSIVDSNHSRCVDVASNLGALYGPKPPTGKYESDFKRVRYYWRDLGYQGACVYGIKAK
jgi:hypothetical protein